MKRFFSRSTPSKTPSPGHRLDLSAGQGFLELRYLDLPPSCNSERHYLRQRDTSRVPLSYRSGLAFFAMVMVVSMFSLTAVEAQTRADSHRSLLHTQLVESFSQLATGLEKYSPKESTTLEVDLGIPSLETYIDPLEQQALLVRIHLQVREGQEAFQDFISSWEQPAPLLEKLQWMHRSAEKSLRVWNEIFLEVQSFPLYQLTSEKREQFRSSIVVMNDLRTFLANFLSIYDPLVSALGEKSPQRILFFIQDDHERRATGGALSAGMEVLLENGEIISKAPFHVADYDDQSRIELPPPSELSELSSQWNLSTANAFLDVPKSIDQIHWFWQREARNSPDFIILISSQAFDRVQSFIPSSLSENTSLRWSALRLKNDRSALKTLASQLLESVATHVSQPEGFFQLLPLLEELKQRKQLMIIPTDASSRLRLADFSPDGSIPQPGNHEDVLMVSRMNQDANASDRWISEQIRLHTSISESGTIRNWLKIERKHRWESAFRAPLLEKIGMALPSSIVSLLSSGPHRSISRILVPKGSRIITVDGLSLSDISIQDSGSHTIWSFPQRLTPGEVKSVGITYELPWTFDTQTVDNYRLQLLKQPGTPPVPFEHLLKLPKDLSVFQRLPEEPITLLSGDEQVAVVAGRNP